MAEWRRFNVLLHSLDDVGNLKWQDSGRAAISIRQRMTEQDIINSVKNFCVYR